MVQFIRTLRALDPIYLFLILALVLHVGVLLGFSRSFLNSPPKSLPPMRLTFVQDPSPYGLASETTTAFPSAQEKKLNNLLQHYDAARLPKTQPFTKTLSAHFHFQEEQAYLQEWFDKVEHIGNQFYPKEAKKLNIQGDLRVLVQLKLDGSINHMAIRRSSGSALLDKAALNILKKAAPFMPVPSELLENHEFLDIISTFYFQGVFHSQQDS